MSITVSSYINRWFKTIKNATEKYLRICEIVLHYFASLKFFLKVFPEIIFKYLT